MSEVPARPLVTIGICTFNRLRGTFPETLATALAQTFSDVEILVCDNASADGTDAFMATQTDPRLRYHRHPENVGANGNFNSCVDLARGRYFQLLHDDDLIEPDFVARAMEVCGDREPGVLLAGSRVVDGEGRVLSTTQAPPDHGSASAMFEAWFAKSFSFYLCTTIFHTERLRETGGFESPEGLFQDVVAIARLSARFGYVSIPGVGGSFRKHAANRGAAQDANRWIRDAAFLLESLCEEMPDRADRLRAVGAPYLSNTCYRYASTVASRPDRRRLYREIYERFGRTYAPWRYLWRMRRRRLRRRVGRMLRATRTLRRAPG